MKTESYVNVNLLIGLIAGGLLFTALAFVGLHFLFLTSTLDTLSWLLSGSLIALPGLAGFAFWLGKIEARGALNVIDKVTTSLAPMTVANVRAQSIYEKDMDRRVSQRMAREMLTGLSEAIPQLTSGNGNHRGQGEIIDNGEVTL